MAAPIVQSDASFEEISQLIWNHLEARNWNSNDARSTVISMVLEASELLEHYQWGEKPVGNREELGEELADVLIYAFQVAHKNNIDIPAAIKDKLEKSARKYPAENFKDATAEDRRKAWLEAKMNHQKKGL